MMHKLDGMIIAFEGLDCSFKETNYNAFVEKLKDTYPEYSDRIITESFPRYDNESAIHIKKWLDGSYDREFLKKHPSAVNGFYSEDRFAFWYEKDMFEHNLTMKNNRPQRCFVFDRYTFSNPLYNPRHGYNSLVPSSKEFTIESTAYGIPNPNIVVWMRMNNFEVLSKLIEEKSGKDENELDLEFLHNVWKRFNNIIKLDYCKELNIEQVIVDCLDSNGNIRSKEEIFNDVWNGIMKKIDVINKRRGVLV